MMSTKLTTNLIDAEEAPQEGTPIEMGPETDSQKLHHNDMKPGHTPDDLGRSATHINVLHGPGYLKQTDKDQSPQHNDEVLTNPFQTSCW
jgi:hypothetical protein